MASTSANAPNLPCTRLKARAEASRTELEKTVSEVRGLQQQLVACGYGH
jgi:hypothetical protein